MNYTRYPQTVVAEIVQLRQRFKDSSLSLKVLDKNLIIGSWNIRNFGGIFEGWDENPDSPKRNLRAMAYIAEVVTRFDVIAIQEVKSDTSGIRRLVQDFLGADWGLILSDVSAGDKGNAERLAFIYDKRRVTPSGLAGEIVLPATAAGDPQQQFDRTPYIVGFQSANDRFALLTAHIRYGAVPADRIGELTNLAQYIASEIRDRAGSAGEERNLIVLGDFNIDDRGDNPLFQAFVSTGLVVPTELLNLKTTYATKPKYYDQIAWFMGQVDLITTGRAGVVDFVNILYEELSPNQMSYRVSDHFPIWVEFIIDHSAEQMAQVLGIDPGIPSFISALE